MAVHLTWLFTPETGGLAHVAAATLPNRGTERGLTARANVARYSTGLAKDSIWSITGHEADTAHLRVSLQYRPFCFEPPTNAISIDD